MTHCSLNYLIGLKAGCSENSVLAWKKQFPHEDSPRDGRIVAAWLTNEGSAGILSVRVALRLDTGEVGEFWLRYLILEDFPHSR